MPKLLKDELGERNLFTDPTDSKFVVRKYVNGQEYYKKLHTRNRREAIRLKDEILKEWAGTRPEPGKTPFRDMAIELLDIMMSKAEKTYLAYETPLRLRLLPFFGGGSLEDIRGRWDEYKAKQRQVDPNRKLNHDRKALIQVFNYAASKNDGLAIPKLPLDLKDKYVEPGRVFSIEEYWKLRDAANEKWKLIIEMAFVMGMRRKEIFHLEWSEIDFSQGIIVLPPAKTKTRQGRVFPIEKQILVALAARKTNNPTPWVFPRSQEPHKPMALTMKSWQRIQKRAGVRGKFHWLRHSNATLCLRAGHSATLIGKAKGMSAQVLERVYAHAEIEDAKRMNQSVRRLVNRKNSESKPTNNKRAGND